VNALSQVKKVIGIAGGKGGVGKSLVTGLLAAGLAAGGQEVAILDADIANPAIPRMFELPQSVTRGEAGLYPAITDSGIKVMSIGLLTEDETDTVTTRGLVMAGIVEQFWATVVWDQVDCLLIDLPSGLGDVTEFAFERLQLDGIILVTTAQELANQAARRTIRLALEHQVPILGLVENFSNSFDGNAAEAVSRAFQLPILDRLPLDFDFSTAADTGRVEAFTPYPLAKTIEVLITI